MSLSAVLRLRYLCTLALIIGLFAAAQVVRVQAARSAAQSIAALEASPEHPAPGVEEIRAEQSRLLALERCLIALALGVLLLSGWGVFRPLVRHLEEVESTGPEPTGPAPPEAQSTAAEVRPVPGAAGLLPSVLDQMRDGVVVADADGTVVLHNPAAMRIGGSNLQGNARDLWTGGVGLFQDDGTSPARWEELPLNRVIHGEDHAEAEFLVRGPGTEGTWIHAIAWPLSTRPGDRQGAVMVFRDVTARHRAEQDLRDLTDELTRSNRDLEQFAYVASHDLQEPLRVVRSYVQLLDRRYKDQLDDEAGEFFDFIIGGTRRMSNLIRDLLAYSRAGPARLQPQPAPLEQALEEALANLQASIEESSAEVTWEDLPLVEADPVQLTQLLQNLVANAIRFRGERAPKVEVSARREGRRWRIAVSDNGIGIDPEYQDRIFSIFQRLHTRESYPGTGIGLSICKRIVEGHGGAIGVESQEGHGSVFWFTLRGAEARPR